MINIIAITVLLTTQIINAKVPLYAIYTPSHEIMLRNYFLPSLKDNFDLHLYQNEQTCRSTAFKDVGWKDTTKQKVKMIIDAIKQQWNGIFIYSDVDIQFFTPVSAEIKELLTAYDLVIQKDDPTGSICSGFFACRCNEKTLQLWQDVLNTMENKQEYSDQAALNHCLISCKNPYELAWTYLPDTYFGGGTFSGKRWNPYNSMVIPNNPKMHHANWTVGVNNKIAQLNYVKYLLRKRKLKKD
ncbi:hypothetical protein IPH25_04835 [bacterium]|nr:MAG: hypothetical protein IPG37_01840 [bacterium]QQR61764.1 MAG: hypothetical protein IPH25_04835 [bacterium]